MEKLILRGFFVLGIGLFPVIVLRKPAKDRLIVFFLTGFLASLLDGMMVRAKRVAYPLRIFKRFGEKSILFDYLIFPLCCTLFIQVTSHSKPSVILGKAVLFSFPITLFEWLLEQKTHLIEWFRWSSVHTFLSVTLYFLMTRVMIGGINKFTKLGLLEKGNDKDEKKEL